MPRSDSQAPPRPRKKGKKGKKQKPRLSRTHKPPHLSLEEWQIELRKQFGREQKFRIVNHGDDPRAFLDRLPMDRVVQLHIAGGHWHDGQLVDSHARPTAPEVWDLVDEVVARAPVRGIILERDEDLPPFGDLLAELDRARELGRHHRRWA